MALAYTVEELAHELKISRASAYLMVKRGEVRVVKLAGSMRVPHSEIERLLAPDASGDRLSA